MSMLPALDKSVWPSPDAYTKPEQMQKSNERTPGKIPWVFPGVSVRPWELKEYIESSPSLCEELLAEISGNRYVPTVQLEALIDAYPFLLLIEYNDSFPESSLVQKARLRVLLTLTVLFSIVEVSVSEAQQLYMAYCSGEELSLEKTCSKPRWKSLQPAGAALEKILNPLSKYFRSEYLRMETEENARQILRSAYEKSLKEKQTSNSQVSNPEVCPYARILRSEVRELTQ